jgi:hypothetical protein
MAIVEIKPIEREKWHGYTGKKSFARPVIIEALVSVETGQYATGLTEEERKDLEDKTGFDLSPEYIPEKTHPFWNSPTGQVRLENKTNIFDTSRPLDFIKVKLLKACDLVANSQKEYEDGLYPDALFVIFDEQEETARKASRAAIKRKVIVESEKLPISKKVEIIQILLGTNTKNQSNDYIDLKFEEAIDKVGAEKVLSIMNRDNKKNTTHALVLEALQKNVLRKEGSAIYYFDDQLGFDLEATIDYLSDVKNQALKAQIIEKVNSF